MRIHYTTQFKKDYKKAAKQGNDLDKLKAVIKKLNRKELLDPTYRDHPLSGNWKNHRDCHIGPDWLLIYRIAADGLFLERTGSHSELFKK